MRRENKFQKSVIDDSGRGASFATRVAVEFLPARRRQAQISPQDARTRGRGLRSMTPFPVSLIGGFCEPFAPHFAITSDIPAVDGAKRISDAGANYRDMMDDYSRAVDEFNAFIKNGTIPERLNKS
jgi:hypothetical protein